MRRIAQQFWVGGGGRRGEMGNALRLGMTYCRLLKWSCGDLERRGDFVNCTLLDLFFVCFTFVQICALKLPPFLFLICSGSERYVSYAE
jgi:hypothetical protein